jgi:hypothetical protein
MKKIKPHEMDLFKGNEQKKELSRGFIGPIGILILTLEGLDRNENLILTLRGLM